jgi:2-polyprenyl-6-methoxyphenol hydroxylase-like FAD-dependent oxidoreductase
LFKIIYDFARYGYSDAQWIIDPKDCGMICGIEGNMWRIAYVEEKGISHDEIRARMPAKFERMLPGNPKPEDYEIRRFQPYAIHQRCAPSMREGRIVLAADAGHLCNPMSVSFV